VRKQLCFTRKEIKQERQCTYDVTSRRVPETIVSVGKQNVLHNCVCVRARARVRVCASSNSIKLTPANSPKDTILHLEPGESFRSR
jgi:hypothetical protein